MKSIWKSKTFWANLLSLGATVATASGHPAAVLLADPATQAQMIGIATVIANIALRIVTTEPVKVLP